MKIYFKRPLLYLLLIGLLCAACSDNETEPTPTQPEIEVPDTISGERYDYTKTGKPERPYMYPYHTMMIMKMFMAQPDGKGGTIIKMNYDDVLENIKKVDQLTRGITKIVYLVGWQFNGHDDKYPAMNVFNEALKRAEDTTARESYMFVKNEAKKYNTILSVHINMVDAYTNSPLWHTYVKNDLICKNADGRFLQWGSYNNLPTFQVCLPNEWKKGFTQKRIDEVIELLDLTDSKTVHIDAFEPRESPYHGYSKETSTTIMRKILRYWRNKGIDVTSEFYRGYQRIDTFVGLQPAAWYNDLTAEERAAISPELACGGRGGLYGAIWDTAFLFGDNMHGEDLFGKHTDFEAFKKEFCITTLQFTYLNQHQVKEYNANEKTVIYSDGLIVNANNKTITQQGSEVRQQNNLLMPATWIKSHRELIAYSETGYSTKTWSLPENRHGVKSANVYTVSENGLGNLRSIPIENGRITLSLKANEMLSIQVTE